MICNWKHCVVLLIFSTSLISTIILADNLALLSETLRTFNKSACDQEWVILQCPIGTTISIEEVHYGRNLVGTDDDLLLPPPCSATSQVHVEGITKVFNTSCTWSQAIQAVVGLCQKKVNCRFQASPTKFGGDPCPGMLKYVNIKYKCRPSEFKSVIGCEDQVLELQCNKSSRIAVFSANYGRTEYEGVQCPQPKGVPEETCLTNNSTGIVMQMCHGKRKCALIPDPATFGNPCSNTTHVYLKIVHICVPRRILGEKYQQEQVVEPDELSFDEDEYEEPGFVEEPKTYAQDHLKSWIPIPMSTADPKRQTMKENVSSEEEDQERLYLYIALCVSSSLLVAVLLVLIKLSRQPPRWSRQELVQLDEMERQRPQLTTTTASPASAIPDFCSESGARTR